MSSISLSAKISAKYDALYFAEKSNSLHSWPRDFARYAFGSVKELILLRDPRDLYCSHRHYFKSDQQTALDQVRSACEALISLYNRDATDIFFIHYEKMLCKERSTYDALSSFLGVPISSEDRTGREMHLFTEHSTSYYHRRLRLADGNSSYRQPKYNG